MLIMEVATMKNLRLFSASAEYQSEWKQRKEQTGGNLGTERNEKEAKNLAEK
jgi:hypothetical protein